MDVRTFETLSEIESLEGFKKDNPVNSKNYSQIIGDYNFNEEVECCREKPNGNLCKRAHKFGYCAILKDGSITIIGNHCATTKFDKEDKIRKDIKLYQNKKDREDKLTRLQELLNDKAQSLKELEHFSTIIKELEQRVSNFIASIGGPTKDKLVSMAKSGNTAVIVNSVSFREYEDDDGYKKKEKTSVPSRIGSLNGLNIFIDNFFKSFYSSIRDIKLAYTEGLKIQNDVSTRKLEALANRISAKSRIENHVNNIVNECDTFFNNDMLLLCFIISDKAERYKNARIALLNKGEPAGKEKSKSWLSEKENEIKEALNADKIELL